MDIYEAADRTLAELLGWTDIKPYNWYGTMRTDGNSPKGGRDFVPRWTLDDGEAFRLMVEHQCFPQYEDSWHKIIIGFNYYDIVSVDMKQSMRYAIVQAVIHKLSNQHNSYR